MNLENMTAEEKEILRKQLVEEDRQKKAERKAKVDAYKNLVDETVINEIDKIKNEN